VDEASVRLFAVSAFGVAFAVSDTGRARKRGADERTKTVIQTPKDCDRDVYFPYICTNIADTHEPDGLAGFTTTAHPHILAKPRASPTAPSILARANTHRKAAVERGV
jgi:hypothetical protein